MRLWTIFLRPSGVLQESNAITGGSQECLGVWGGRGEVLEAPGVGSGSEGFQDAGVHTRAAAAGSECVRSLKQCPACSSRGRAMHVLYIDCGWERARCVFCSKASDEAPKRCV